MWHDSQRFWCALKRDQTCADISQSDFQNSESLLTVTFIGGRDNQKKNNLKFVSMRGEYVPVVLSLSNQHPQKGEMASDVTCRSENQSV